MEEAGAINVAAYFLAYSSHRASLRHIRTVLRERLSTPDTRPNLPEDAQVGEKILQAWYYALATEDLQHLIDSSRSHRRTLPLTHGPVVSVMGAQNLRNCGCVHTRDGLQQFWEETESTMGISMNTAAAADMVRDNEVVRMLTAHCMAAEPPSQSSPEPSRAIAALICVSPRLPALLGTDWRLVGSSAAMSYRWNFYADVQLVNFLPSFFLSKSSRGRLKQLMKRGLLPSTCWSAPAGSPSDLALQLIMPSITPPTHLRSDGNDPRAE